MFRVLVQIWYSPQAVEGRGSIVRKAVMGGGPKVGMGVGR